MKKDDPPKNDMTTVAARRQLGFLVRAFPRADLCFCFCFCFCGRRGAFARSRLGKFRIFRFALVTYSPNLQFYTYINNRIKRTTTLSHSLSLSLSLSLYTCIIITPARLWLPPPLPALSSSSLPPPPLFRLRFS